MLVIEPEKEIAEWRENIEKSKAFTYADRESKCVFGTITSLFDNLHIHSLTIDALGVLQKDSVTTIPMEREARFGNFPWWRP